MIMKININKSNLKVKFIRIISQKFMKIYLFIYLFFVDKRYFLFKKDILLKEEFWFGIKNILK